MTTRPPRHESDRITDASKRPRVVAHRGASAIAPENTMAAFRLAIDAGAEMIETDAHLTLDDEIVLIHDADLRRTTNCIGSVADRRLADLDGCDAGYWFEQINEQRHPFRGLGLVIPRLTELLSLVSSQEQPVGMNVELKNLPGEASYDPTNRLAQHLVDELNAADMLSRVLVSSFNPDAIDRVKALEPRCRTAYLCGPGDDLRADAARARANAHDAIHPHHSLLTSGNNARKLVDGLHGMGLEVNVWTVNDPQRMLEMEAAGVDGIIADDPEKLRRVLARNDVST